MELVIINKQVSNYETDNTELSIMEFASVKQVQNC